LPATIKKIFDGENVSFNLKFKDIDETRQLRDDFTIRDLLDELELSTQTTVAKRNGELTLEDTVINDGDEIQIVQIIYGG
jgi:sulfur carrier protein